MFRQPFIIKRKKISGDLKAKVAIEALKGIKTINEIASLYAVHPNQVCSWKKQFTEQVSTLFDKPMKESQRSEISNDHLYRKIGQLEIENDFLKKKWEQMQKL